MEFGEEALDVARGFGEEAVAAGGEGGEGSGGKVVGEMAGEGGEFGIGGTAEEGNGRKGEGRESGGEVGLGAEGPVEESAGDFGAPRFGEDVRGGRGGALGRRRALQDRLGVPGGKEVGPRKGQAALLPSGVVGEAGGAQEISGEAGVNGEEERAVPEAGLLLENVEGEAAAQGVAGEEAGAVGGEGGDLLIEPARKAFERAGRGVAAPDFPEGPSAGGKVARERGEPVGGLTEIAVEGVNHGGSGERSGRAAGGPVLPKGLAGGGVGMEFEDDAVGQEGVGRHGAVVDAVGETPLAGPTG